MDNSAVIFGIKTFAILGSYAAHVDIYRRFWTTYRSNLQSSSFTPEEVTVRLFRNAYAVKLPKRAKFPFKQRRKPEVQLCDVLEVRALIFRTK
jgi:hypothetical protein